MAHRPINEAGIKLIQDSEGLGDGDKTTDNFDPYLDPVGIWTIGWGHVIYRSGKRLEGAARKSEALSVYPQGITLDEAELLLKADLIKTCNAVSRLVTVPTSDNEFAALVSFTFNLGSANLEKSTLLRALNAENRFEAANQFDRWVFAKGQKLPGLIKRRIAERTLFLSP